MPWMIGVLVVAAGCGPAERSWHLVSESVPEGVIMAGALMEGGTPLLVGGQAEAGAAWRYEGGAVKAEAVPAGRLLSWASRAADGAMLVVGLGRRALWRATDGSWSSEALPDGDELWGCVAFTRDDAWAVGGDPRNDGTFDPVLLRRQASGWSKVALPQLSRPGARLFKIDGHGSNDVVAVGDLGLAIAWNGAGWSEEGSGTGSNLTTVRALDGGRYVAVGGMGAGVVLLREGGAWRKLRDAQAGLSGVEQFEGSVWACGSDGWLEKDALDGSSSIPVKPALTRDSLHWVLRLPSGDGLSGGGNLAVWPAPMHGTLLSLTQ